ncbi:unnamed protein product [Ambrosiozyma monospora]|uniref:Unnamed protein product n=1 Tax=Ambrosiozyma monospora TaxID=43982 RepID=A0A9W7DII1_AMBMO|nr:unnamed protein product [Ambrosiozyma monospora]
MAQSATTTEKRQKTALVTGCSSGIGYYAALELASKGYKVFACARRLEPMEPLKKAYPGQIIPFAMDVSSIESINKGYDFVFAELGGVASPSADAPHSVPKLDVLYNNAGQSYFPHWSLQHKVQLSLPVQSPA